MSSHEKNLNQLIAQVRSRRRARLALRGLAMTLAVFAAALVLAAVTAFDVSDALFFSAVHATNPSSAMPLIQP